VSILIVDLETNGFKPNTIWVCGILDYDTNVYTPYMGEDIAEGIMRAAEADILIAHNGIDYDIPVMERLSGGLITFDRDKVVDTLVLGRRLLPEMKCQKLEEWGDILGWPKIKFNEGFDVFHPAMVPYCERDCQVTKMVFDFLMELTGPSEE
jgi:DNA polymerase III alpha subunit (gram-positive type)